MAEGAIEFKASIKELKGGFFDRDYILDRVENAKRNALSKFGVFVFTTARGFIRKGKNPSKPGKPPKGHGSELLKRFILFAYDDARDSVVIGPGLLNRGSNAPRLNEYGGTAPGRQRRRVEIRRALRADGRNKSGQFIKKSAKQGGYEVKRAWVTVGSAADTGDGPVKTEYCTYPARPYMRPAFIKARGDLEKFWARSVKK